MVLGESTLGGVDVCCSPRHAFVPTDWRTRADHDGVYSRQAIQKYIRANNNLGDITDNAFKGHVNRAITAGEEKGDFTRPKGESRALPVSGRLSTMSTHLVDASSSVAST